MYYNYVYLDPRKPGKFVYGKLKFDYEPFYIGKGKDERCYEHLKNCHYKNDNDMFKHSDAFHNKLRKLLRCNFEPIIQIIKYYKIEGIAYKNETNIISLIGSRHINTIKDGPLENVCLDNRPPNHKGKTYEEIYGIEEAKNQKKKRNDLQRSKGGYFGGHKHTEKSKLKTSQALSGPKHPFYGTHFSESTKQKISLKAKERYKTQLHPSSLNFIAISPFGEKYFLKGNVKQFCLKNNISYSTLRKTLNTKKPVSHGKTKNWFLQKEH